MDADRNWQIVQISRKLWNPTVMLDIGDDLHESVYIDSLMEKSLWNLMLHLKKSGWDHKVLNFREQPSKAERLGSQGIEFS